MTTSEHSRLLEHIRDIRQADVTLIRHKFPRGSCVLELGGGNGYQASLIESWGCTVESIDVEAAPDGDPRFHPVQLYDGLNIPFDDAGFDIVYSSLVLEHVPDPIPLLRQTRRVMKDDGVGIYILPSAAWRFWTLITHYAYLAKRALRLTKPAPPLTSGPSPASTRPQSIWNRLCRLLVSSAHGEYPNAVSELFYFSKYRWVKVFAQGGLTVVEAKGNGVFYTGYRIFPSLAHAPRRLLAKCLASPCHVFTVRKTTDQ